MPRITKGLVEKAATQPRDYILWDSEVVGFGVRIRPSGRRIYLFKYRSPDGRQRKLMLGQHGNITAEQARKAAQAVAGRVAAGEDPAAKKGSDRSAPTVVDLCRRFVHEHATIHKKTRSAVEDQRLIDRWIAPAIGRLQVSSITRNDIAKLHHSMRELPYAGNRALALLSKMFNLAEKWGLRPDASNPCRHVQKYREEKRERFLSPDELARLSEALEAAERDGSELPSVITGLRLLLLTGCRRNEVLELRWDWVDLQAGTMRLPDSKTGAKVVHLGAPARALLAELPRENGNPFVLVGAKPGAHLVNIEKPWRRIRARAGLDDVRLHDLRHTFTSYGAAANLSLPIIGKMLGQTQASTTHRYAHLSADPVRLAVDTVSASIASAMNGSRTETSKLAMPRLPDSDHG